MTDRSTSADAILATWSGRCPFCARPIRRGDLVVNVAGQWLHDDCERVVETDRNRELAIAAEEAADEELER